MRLHGHEVVRRVYPVFQDRNWTARPWIVEDEQVEQRADGFLVTARGRGSFDAAAFTWQVTIEGRSDGTIELDFTGTSDEAFLRNRLGLCVLHPVRELAGTPVTVTHVDGSTEVSTFPGPISPDQPFRDLRALTHEPVPGVRVSVRMEGETFESEDHRNWSDASYKHYCTPIDLPFPVEVQPGDVIEQRVTISVGGDAPAETSTAGPARIEVSDAPVALPRLGIQLDHDGHRLTDHEVELLRALGLAHVRVDLGPTDGPQRLEEALADAQRIGAALVVALTGASAEDLAAFRDHPGIDRWMAFDPATKVIDPAAVEATQAILGDRVAGGTNLYFTELNRGRPASRGFITFSVNPQVHAWDDRTVMQNAWTLGPIAAQARALYPDAFLELSPLTLRPRWNPNATAPELDVSSTALPSRVDARQCQPFTAAWTVLALAALTQAPSLDAVTLFEATGWEGLVERGAGSPQPDDFPSTPGSPFPIYHVLRLVAGQTTVLPTSSSDPDVAAAIALPDGRVIVANATDADQQVQVEDTTVDLPPYGVVVIERSSS